ncbi:hypothetical protein PENTCL1PPCAC_11011, partial [Pristionchus entomophagus]
THKSFWISHLCGDENLFSTELSRSEIFLQNLQDDMLVLVEFSGIDQSIATIQSHSQCDSQFFGVHCRPRAQSEQRKMSASVESHRGN